MRKKIKNLIFTPLKEYNSSERDVERSACLYMKNSPSIFEKESFPKVSRAYLETTCTEEREGREDRRACGESCAGRINAAGDRERRSRREDTQKKGR